VVEKLTAPARDLCERSRSPLIYSPMAVAIAIACIHHCRDVREFSLTFFFMAAVADNQARVSVTTPFSGIKDALQSLGVVPDNIVLTPPSPKLEYLFEDEGDIRGPSFGARLCYGAGFTYLTGLVIGGTWGIFEGLAHPDAKTKRLRVNAILNACTRRGPFLSNNMGIIAVMYNVIQYGLVKSTSRDYDMYSALSAAAISGYLFRASAGPKQALITSLTCSIVMGSVELVQDWKTWSYRLKTWIAS
jgi:inner membrane translocase subunit Tim23